MTQFHHVTVLQQEAITALNVKKDGIYVDCTLGGGGHSEGIASLLGDSGRLIGLDQDEAAISAAKERLAPFGERVSVMKRNFRFLSGVLQELQVQAVDGLLFDLGLSSPQVDWDERGFSYHATAGLDMRMDQEQPLSAYEVVNQWGEQELSEIIFRYGEERFGRSIARQIVKEREDQPIETTRQLAEVVKKAIPAPARRKGPHPARRTFQAIRIAVNDELGAFEEALQQSVGWLCGGGRIVVITFHSLEDRICKQMFAEWGRGCICPPEFPVCVCGREPQVKVLTRKPVLPSEQEQAENPRSRSAKMRVAEKC